MKRRSCIPALPAAPSIGAVALLLGLLAALFATSTFLPERAAAQGRMLEVNQKRARIEQLIQKIGEAAGRTILVPDDVRGTISIVAKRPVSVDEAWSMLEASLSVLGFSLLPSTVDNWRIAKVAQAVGEAPFRASAGGDGESYVTTLIPLRVASPANVMKVLEPLSGSRVTLVPFEPTNSVIASGSERAIARLTTIADELDQIEEKTFRLRVLRYRGVTEVETFVETFMDSLGGAGRSLQVWSDERTNAILIRGDAEAVDRVMGFLAEVDRPVEGGGAIQILRVLHRDAEELAELVRSLADPTAVAANAGGGAVARAATALDGSDYTIAVDGPSHSLIVRSDPETFLAIREVVEILDAPVELVAVDVTISELRTPTAYGLALGFVAPFATGNDTGDLFGVVVNNPNISGLGDASNIVGQVQRDSGVAFQTTDPLGTPITVPILQSVTVAAEDFEARNEVLIQPSLILTAGDEHEIFVGENVPIPVTGENPAGDQLIRGIPLSAISRTIEFDRRDIGTRLSIEATAGREGRIQLGLDIEISAIDPTSVALAGDPLQVGPSFVEQSLSVTAQLDDGETAVLAMYMEKDVNDLETGIPFLRDLPFFGALFRAKGTLAEDVRLVIAARARRVSSPAELVADTIRRRLTFERRSARENTLPRVKGSPFGVRVTTRKLEEDAIAIAESLDLQGHRTLTHGWSIGDSDYFDVYVIDLPSMVDAAELAGALSKDGWPADLVLLSDRS